MSRQDYEAAIELNNAAVALLHRNHCRYAMSVFQESLYRMNCVIMKTYDDCDAITRTDPMDPECHANQEKEIEEDSCTDFKNDDNRCIPTDRSCSELEYQQDNPMSHTEVYCRHPKRNVVVVSTLDMMLMNPDLFIDMHRSSDKYEMYVAVLIEDNVEYETEVDSVWKNVKYVLHSAIVVFNYAVACQLSALDNPLCHDEISLKKVNEASTKLFHSSFTVLARVLQDLPTSDRVLSDQDDDHHIWYITSGVYYMSMICLHNLADLQRKERDIYLNEIDRLSNNYTLFISDCEDPIVNMVNARAA
jgi:hypothetical protein